MESQSYIKQLLKDDKPASFQEMLEGDPSRIRLLISPGNSKFYAVTPKHIEQAISLELKLKSGSSVAVFCHEIRSPVAFDPSHGISFSTTSGMKVGIEGRNLRPVFEYLLEHRLAWVEEQSGSFDDEGEEATVITSIKVETREEI